MLTQLPVAAEFHHQASVSHPDRDYLSLVAISCMFHAQLQCPAEPAETDMVNTIISASSFTITKSLHKVVHHMKFTKVASGTKTAICLTCKTVRK
jgi:hypothetical protein